MSDCLTAALCGLALWLTAGVSGVVGHHAERPQSDDERRSGFRVSGWPETPSRQPIPHIAGAEAEYEADPPSTQTADPSLGTKLVARGGHSIGATPRFAILAMVARLHPVVA